MKRPRLGSSAIARRPADPASRPPWVARLDLGSSNRRRDGHIAVDVNPCVHPDVMADFNRLPLPFKTDRVVEISATQVAEHLSVHLIDFLKEIYRILEPGGVLILTLPNMFSIRNRLLYLVGRIPESREWNPHHLKLIPPDYLLQLLRHIGFDPSWDYRRLAWIPARYLLAGSLCIRARKRA